MGWIKKREFYSYLLLLWTFGDKPVNVGIVLDLLKFFMPRGTAFNVLRRLIKLGLVKREDPVMVRVLPVEEAFRSRVVCYFYQRLVKLMRSKGLSATVSLRDERVIVVGGLSPGEAVKACPLVEVLEEPLEHSSPSYHGARHGSP